MSNDGSNTVGKYTLFHSDVYGITHFVHEEESYTSREAQVERIAIPCGVVTKSIPTEHGPVLARIEADKYVCYNFWPNDGRQYWQNIEITDMSDNFIIERAKHFADLVMRHIAQAK